MFNSNEKQITVSIHDGRDYQTIEFKTSTNYESFTANPNNRPKDVGLVKKLVESITEHGYFGFIPIIVDCDYVIIDGHHRVFALEEYHKKNGERIPFSFHRVSVSGDMRRKIMKSINDAREDWDKSRLIEVLDTPFAIAYREARDSFRHLSPIVVVNPLSKSNKKREIKVYEYVTVTNLLPVLRIPKLTNSGFTKNVELTQQQKKHIYNTFNVVYHTLQLYSPDCRPPHKTYFINACAIIASDSSLDSVDLKDWVNFLKSRYENPEQGFEKKLTDVYHNKYLKQLSR